MGAKQHILWKLLSSYKAISALREVMEKDIALCECFCKQELEFIDAQFLHLQMFGYTLLDVPCLVTGDRIPTNKMGSQTEALRLSVGIA